MNVEEPFAEPSYSPIVNDQVHRVENVDDFRSPECSFWDASGGTRKTYIINAAQNCLKVIQKIQIRKYLLGEQQGFSGFSNSSLCIQTSCIMCRPEYKFGGRWRFLSSQIEIMFLVTSTCHVIFTFAELFLRQLLNLSFLFIFSCSQLRGVAGTKDVYRQRRMACLDFCSSQ